MIISRRKIDSYLPLLMSYTALTVTDLLWTAVRSSVRTLPTLQLLL